MNHENFQKIELRRLDYNVLGLQEISLVFEWIVSEEKSADRQLASRTSNAKHFIVDHVIIADYHADFDNSEIVWISDSDNRLPFMMVRKQKVSIPTKTSVFSFRFGGVDIWSSEPVGQIQ